jgi:hypothetical protein
MKLGLRIAVVALLLLPSVAGAVGSPSGVPSALAEPGVPMASAPERVPVPEPDAQAIAYYDSGNRLWAVGQFWNLAVPLFVLLSGLSVRMRTLAAHLAPHWSGTVVVFALLYRVFDWLVSRPLGFYGAYRTERVERSRPERAQRSERQSSRESRSSMSNRTRSERDNSED